MEFRWPCLLCCLDFDVKRNANGEIDQVGVSFLLADRNLLKTHSGVMVDQEKTIFKLGPFATNPMEKYIQPYPFPGNRGEELSFAVDRPNKLIPINCQESQDAFTLRFKFLSGDKRTQSGN